MPTVEYVKNDEKTGAVRIAVRDGDERRIFNLGKSTYARIGMIRKGEELTDEVMALMDEENEYRAAKRHALSILSYGDNNERRLIEKLMRKGSSREVAREVAREMVSLGYINESRQLERLVSLDANTKLFGEGRIHRHLVSLGYSAADVRSILLSLCESGEIDFEKNAVRLLEKHGGKALDADTKRKLLFRYGYKVGSQFDFE